MFRRVIIPILLSFMSAATVLNACPFTIYNDSDSQILVVDPNGKHAVCISPKESQTIDPTIKGFPWKYFYKERLNIYKEKDGNPNNFYIRYQLIEKYCAESIKLSLNDIVQFIKKPTDRFDTFEFKPQKHSAHAH